VTSAERRTVGSVVRPTARTVGEPVRTSWDDVDESAAPSVLDDLADVDAPLIAAPATAAVLVRGMDGVYRPVELTDVAPVQRGSVVHYLEQDPHGAVPANVQVGDYLTVIAGDHAGTVYLAQES
jgi:hypothetical protein